MIDIFVPVFLALIAFEIVKETFYDFRAVYQFKKFKKDAGE
jgi:hypothetical protein